VTVKLLHLFPEELSASGDSGNVQTVSYRLSARGIAVESLTWSGSGNLPSDVNAVFIGNGPWSAAKRVLSALGNQADVLRRLAQANVPFFAVGVGAEILSESVVDGQGVRHEGLGIFPFSARREADRRVGYMKITRGSDEFVGFGDFASIWTIADESNALGLGLVGDRSSELFPEGTFVGTAISTRMGGPALPLNPALADLFVGLVLAHAGIPTELARLESDEYPENARAVIFKHLNTHFATIAL
jgi:CobQ-like glutamine amidotransferase family enzyme